MTTIAALMPRIEIRVPDEMTGQLLNQFPSRMVGRQLQIDLVILLTQHAAIETGLVDVLARCRYTVPESGVRFQQSISLPPLVHGSVMDAAAAPVTPAVQIARALEESLRDQREALALDRAGRYEESRQAFGQSHARLAQADAMAATGAYAGVSEEMPRRMRAESARSTELAAAPAMALDEHTRKERAAYRSNASRGNRQGDGQA